SHVAASLRWQLVFRRQRERSLRIVQRRWARAKRRSRKLSAQSALERFCVCANADGRRGETRGGRIARQGISRSPARCERREIRSAPAPLEYRKPLARRSGQGRMPYFLISR